METPVDRLWKRVVARLRQLPDMPLLILWYAFQRAGVDPNDFRGLATPDLMTYRGIHGMVVARKGLDFPRCEMLKEEE